MKSVFALTLLASLLSMSPSSKACNGPLNCTIKTYSGNYVTAVGGGGRTTDAIHTDATIAQAWEKFIFVDSCDGAPTINYGIKTINGNFLTAVSGGGVITEAIRSNETHLFAWEKFKALSLGSGVYALQTINGNYVTAVNGGGKVTDVIHTDARQIGTWERFRIECSL